MAAANRRAANGNMQASVAGKQCFNQPCKLALVLLLMVVKATRTGRDTLSKRLYEMECMKPQVQRAILGALRGGRQLSELADVTFSEEDLGAPPPLPSELPAGPPPLPSEEVAAPLREPLPPQLPTKPREQLAADFHDLLAEKGVRFLSRPRLD